MYTMQNKSANTLVVILGGRGPEASILPEFQKHPGKYDTVVIYPKTKYPNWQVDKSVCELVDEGPIDRSKHVITLIRNIGFKIAIDNGYEYMYQIEDDIKKLVRLDMGDTGKVITSTSALPDLSELPQEAIYGGIIGTQFKKVLLECNQTYSHGIPHSIMYVCLKRMREKLGYIAINDPDLHTWDDFHYALLLRQYGILPYVYVHYAIVKSMTQERTVNSNTSTINNYIERSNLFSYNLYKLWGDNNTILKFKENFVDTYPSRSRVVKPVTHKYDISSLENWLKDIYKPSYAV